MPQQLAISMAPRGAILSVRIELIVSRLCANSYVISTCFSLLSTMPSCIRYISYVGILRIIQNVLFRISIIFDNRAIRPYRFSSYLWLFVFINFWITCTYRLKLFLIYHLIVSFLMKFVECWLYEHMIKELIKSELVYLHDAHSLCISIINLISWCAVHPLRY